MIASFLSIENQRGESIIRRDNPPMLTQSQSVAQQSPPPDEKNRKFLSDRFCAASVWLAQADRRSPSPLPLQTGHIRSEKSKLAPASVLVPSGELFATPTRQVNQFLRTYAFLNCCNILELNVLCWTAKMFGIGEIGNALLAKLVLMSGRARSFCGTQLATHVRCKG